MEDFLRDLGLRVGAITPALFGVPFAVAAVAAWFGYKSWQEDHSLSILAALGVVVAVAAGLVAVAGYFQAKNNCDAIISPVARQEQTFYLFEEPYLTYSVAKCNTLWPVKHLSELRLPIPGLPG